jgi:hypothetical protein
MTVVSGQLSVVGKEAGAKSMADISFLATGNCLLITV